MSGRDRRQYPRLEGHFQVDILNLGDDVHYSPFEAVVEAEALDVSKKGMRLRSSYDAAVGSNLSVIIYFKGHESICLSKVVWKSADGDSYFYGIYFDRWSTLDPDLAQKLSAMEENHSDLNASAADRREAFMAG